MLALAVLLMAVALPSLAGQLSRQRLQGTFDRFDSLVGEARKHSVTDGKPYVLVWKKGGVYLYPADLSNEDRRKNGAMAYADFSGTGDGECVLVRWIVAHRQARAGMDLLAQRQLRAGARCVTKGPPANGKRRTTACRRRGRSTLFLADE